MMMLALTLPRFSAGEYSNSDILHRADSLLDKGIALKAEAQYATAFSYLIEAKSLYEQLGDVSRLASCNKHLGVIWESRSEFDKAGGLFRESLSLYISLGDSLQVAKALNNLGNNYYRRGLKDSAFDCLNQSVLLKESLGQLESANSSRVNLASLAYLEDSLDLARGMLENVVNAGIALGQSSTQIAALNLLGLVEWQDGEYQKATIHFEECRQLASQFGFPEDEEAALSNLFRVSLEYETVGRLDDLFVEYRQFAESQMDSRSSAALKEIEAKFQEAQTAATLAQTQLNAQKQQNRLLLLISALVIAGVILFMYARRQKAIRKAQTAAVLQAREQEQKRISQRLWQEIGKAMQQRDEQTSVFEGDQKTLDGAVQAAKYLSAQHFNPYLQVSLARALEFGCEQYGVQYGALITTEVQDVDVPMAQRKQLYKAFKRTLLDHLDTPGVDKLHVEMHAKEGRIELVITANEAPEKSVLYTAAEAEVAALGGKLKSKSDGAAHRTRIKVPIQG